MRRCAVTSRADELRTAFDREIARPPGSLAAATEELLAIRVGGEPYALRRADVAGLFADKVITPLPGDVAALLGLGGFRGVLVPVYDLRVLLGGTGAAAPRWLVTAAAASVGLAFDGFEALVRVPRDAFVGRDAAVGHVHHVVQTPTGLRPVVAVPSILEAIRAHARPRKE
jgi:chemotaxis signal transduction protein